MLKKSNRFTRYTPSIVPWRKLHSPTRSSPLVVVRCSHVVERIEHPAVVRRRIPRRTECAGRRVVVVLGWWVDARRPRPGRRTEAHWTPRVCSMLCLRIWRPGVRSVQETLVVVVGFLSVLPALFVHLLHVITIVLVDTRRPGILARIVMLLERTLLPPNTWRTTENHARLTVFDNHHDADPASDAPQQEQNDAHAHTRFGDIALAHTAETEVLAALARV